MGGGPKKGHPNFKVVQRVVQQRTIPAVDQPPPILHIHCSYRNNSKLPLKRIISIITEGVFKSGILKNFFHDCTVP